MWGNLDTLVNNAGIITINDLEHQRHGFQGCCNSGGGTFIQLEAGVPVAAISGTERPAGRDEATRHAASAIDRSPTLPTAHDLDITA